MRKTATALTCVALTAGAVLAAAPANAATDQSWASDTSSVDTVTDTFYFNPASPLNFPIKVSSEITVDSAEFWSDARPAVRVSVFDLPSGVSIPFPVTSLGYGSATLSDGTATLTDQGDIDGSNYGISVVATGSTAEAKAAASTVITADTYETVQFSAAGTYALGDKTVTVLPWAADIEPGGGFPQNPDGSANMSRNYTRVAINPLNTQLEFGAPPVYSLVLSPEYAAAPCAPVTASFHKADGTVTPITISADSCAATIPLDTAAFRDAAGNLIPGVLEYEVPSVSGGRVTVNGNSTWSRQPSVSVEVSDTVTPGEDIVVTPERPTVVYDECGEPGRVVLPTIAGLSYVPSGGDTYSTLYRLEVADGYVLAEGSPTSYTVNFAPESCEPGETSPAIDVPDQVLSSVLNEGTTFPFSGFPANTEITFVFSTGDNVLSTSTVLTDENGEGVLEVFARLDNGENVPNGTVFTIVASGEGFDDVTETFTAVDKLTPVDPTNPTNPTTPTTPTTPGGSDSVKGELAYTGGDSTAAALAAGGAVVALLIGGSLVALRRRGETA